MSGSSPSSSPSSSSPSSPLQQWHTTASSDLNQLKRVFHKIAMTDNTQLEKVLNLLLPRLLGRVGSNQRNVNILQLQQSQTTSTTITSTSKLTSNGAAMMGAVKNLYDNIHAKLVEMLSHIITRVKADSSCKLPVQKILDLLTPTTVTSTSTASDNDDKNKVDPFTINLSLIFLTIGVPRCTLEELYSLLPNLLTLVSVHTNITNISTTSKKKQAFQIAHLVIRTIEGIIVQTKANKKSSSSMNDTISTNMQKARTLCQTNPYIGATMFDLCLDVLLFQTNSSTTSGTTSTSSSTNLPPPGLSTFANERLLSGSSTSSSSSWLVEYSTNGRLRDLKLAFLDFIAPSRQWDLFHISQKQKNESENEKENENESSQHHQQQQDKMASAISTARVVSLMVVSTGDTHIDVTERASAYLKFHMDSMRNQTSTNTSASAGASTNTSTSTNNSTNSNTTHDPSGTKNRQESNSSYLLGQPITLTCSLMKLVLGDILSENIIASSSSSSSTTITTKEQINENYKTLQTSLGLFYSHGHDHDHGQQGNNSNSNIDKSVLMSTKRRMVSEKTATTIMTFITSRVLEDIPQIFTSYTMSLSLNINLEQQQQQQQQSSVLSYMQEQEQEQEHKQDPEHQFRFSCMSSAYIIGKLVIAVTQKFVSSSGRSLSKSSITGSLGNSSVASAKLLNSTCVRLVPLYDGCIDFMEGMYYKADKSTTMIDHLDDEMMYKGMSHLAQKIENVLAQFFAISCSILSVASSTHSGDVRNTIGIETRDSSYGTVSCLCRSKLYLSAGTVFDCGIRTEESSSNSSNEMPLSTNTATLLFGCVANETETLKPRAIAALDSLLSAYCRLFDKQSSSSSNDTSTAILENDNNDVVMNSSEPSNPWQQDKTLYYENCNTTNPTSRNFNFSNLSRSLLPLLWKAAQSSQSKTSRHAAAKWSFQLLKPLDLTSACHILCFVSGDKDATASSVAKDGLGLSSELGEDEVSVTMKDGKEIVTPDFADFINVVCMSNNNQTASWRPTFWDFSPRGQASALRFGLICLLNDLYGGDDNAVNVYLNHIGETLHRISTFNQNAASPKSRDMVELLDEASICLAGCLRASSFAREKTASSSCVISHQQIASLAITANSSKSRRHLAAAFGLLLEDSSIWNKFDDDSNSSNVDHWVQYSEVQLTMKRCSEKLNTIRSSSCNIGEVHGSVFLSSWCIRALRLFNYPEKEKYECFKSCLEMSSTIISQLGFGTLHSDDIVGNACSSGLATALSYDDVDSPVLHIVLFDGVAEALDLLCKALKKFGNGDHTNPNRISFLSKATGVLLAASTVRIIPTSDVQSPACDIEEIRVVSEKIGRARLECVESLFALLGSSSYRKDQEIILTVGEALALYADAYSPNGAQWTMPLQPRPTLFETAYANDLPPHVQIIYTLLHSEMKANSPHKRTACAPVLLALVARATTIVRKDALHLQRAFTQEIVNNLVDIQMAFLLLLSDPKSKQLARESCCIGLSACYSLSLLDSKETMELNERVLKAFGQTSNHGGSALMESRAQNAQRRMENQADGSASVASRMEEFGIGTEVGGAVGMGEAALGAYKEMANAAIMLGRPDVLYSLMLLSVNLPIWSTGEYRNNFSSSALGLGNKSSEDTNIKEALKPYLKHLIPRLLRACNDPNSQTREQMTTLWIGLTGGGADARALVNENLITTVDTLIGDATNKLWRTRVGACGALSDMIVGRGWEELGGGEAMTIEDNPDAGHQTAASRLLRLFRTTVRSLDDVRLTVRESGETLSRSVRSLTIRLCDASKCNEGNGSFYTNKSDKSSLAAAATALPWLVQYGLNQPCAEATGFAISCLLGIVEVAKPRTLQPVLPDLIGSLLMAQSGLEPAALNYLQTRAAGQDSNRFEQLERLRLQMAQSGPISVALATCLDMVKSLDTDSQKAAIIPHIDSAIRCGAGFATRAAAADAVSTLCSNCPTAFKFNGSSTSNPTVRLLRALYYASERERGSAARDKMTHAFGNIAKLAPGASVRSLALRLCERYKLATGSNNDPKARKAAAAALRAIAVRASNQFQYGGSNNIWMKRVLPISYLGRKDKEVCDVFQEVWDEGGQAANLADISAIHMTLQEKILPYLTKSIIDALDDVSWERRVIACSTLNELCGSNILSPSPRMPDPSSYKPEDLISRARQRSESSHKILSACVKLITNTRVWDGKEHLLETTSKIAVKWIEKDGIADDDDQCKPIFVHDMVWDNLFVDDGWFLHNLAKVTEDGENTIPPEEERSTDIEEDESNHTEIDFNEGDKILNTENLDDDEVMEEGSPLISFTGLVRLLYQEGVYTQPGTFYSSVALPYRSAALHGLSQLLESCKQANLLSSIYDRIAQSLIFVIQNNSEDKIPPLIVSRATNCLSCLFWEGINGERVHFLVKLFSTNCEGARLAWTIRESSAYATAKLALTTDAAILCKLEMLDSLIKCSQNCLRDQKYWKVRVAGLSILQNLCKRSRNRTSSIQTDMDKKQLVLEALLPFKEKIVKLATSTLTDKESNVAIIASEIIDQCSWWP